MKREKAIERINRLLDSSDPETANTSMRLPVALREAAAVAVRELGAAPSTTALASAALRAMLEAIAMQAVLDDHYHRHPESRPGLADLAIAAAELDGHPLARQPEQLRLAADQIARTHPDADADDVLLWAEAPSQRLGMISLVLLDNEAVQALGTVEHPKHRKVLSHVQVVAQRKRRAVQVNVGVPTTVRVEAGWDRTAATWAFANRLRIGDLVLDAAHANIAAEIRRRAEVSVADAHIGAVIRTTTDEQIIVLTSDPADIPVVAGDRAINIVTI